MWHLPRILPECSTDTYAQDHSASVNIQLDILDGSYIISFPHDIRNKDLPSRIIKAGYVFHKAIIYPHRVSLLDHSATRIIIHNMLPPIVLLQYMRIMAKRNFKEWPAVAREMQNEIQKSPNLPEIQ